LDGWTGRSHLPKKTASLGALQLPIEGVALSVKVKIMYNLKKEIKIYKICTPVLYTVAL
jgi:hypothetical protein